MTHVVELKTKETRARHMVTTRVVVQDLAIHVWGGRRAKVKSQKSNSMFQKVDFSSMRFWLFYGGMCIWQISIYNYEKDKTKFKFGRNIGLEALVVCQLLEVVVPKLSKDLFKIKLRKLGRSDYISSEKAYVSDI